MSVEQSLSSPCTRTQGTQSLEDATEGLALELMTQSPGNVGTVTRRSLPFFASFEALSTACFSSINKGHFCLKRAMKGTGKLRGF